MNDFLQVNHLEKSYYNINGEYKALKDITFSVKNQEFIAIVGPSGCGKSTLLSILANLESKTNGEIKYQKNKIVIGYMLQNDALFDWLTVFDNAILGLKIKKIDSEKNIETVKKMLIKYGLKDFIDKYPNQLSGGMRQRVALIRTLAINPDILLLDEPFCSLDYMNRLYVSNDVYNIIKDNKVTTILVTHDLAEAISLADRIIVLSKCPSIVKKEVIVDSDKRLNPIERRKDNMFSYYYELLWKELDNHVS